MQLFCCFESDLFQKHRQNFVIGNFPFVATMFSNKAVYQPISHVSYSNFTNVYSNYKAFLHFSIFIGSNQSK